MTETSFNAQVDNATRESSDNAKLAANPMVSVVMLAYRHEKYLAQAITSVLSQKTEYSYELIIGEDCSPDTTRDIALQFQRTHPDRIRVIYSDQNVGGLSNSERTIRAARGRYIAFCEGDDYWQSREKLQLQVDLMESSPTLSACHSDFDRRIGWRIKRNAHARRPPRFPAIGDAYPNVLRSWTVMTATAMYRGGLLKEYLNSDFNRSDFPFGDYNKLLFASIKGQIGYIPHSLATWRKVRGSASNSGFKSILRLRTAALECRQQFIAAFPIDIAVEKEAIALAHKDIMNAAFVAGDIPRYKESLHARKLLGYGESPWSDAWRLLCMQLKFPGILIRAYKTVLQVLATWDPTLIFGQISITLGRHRGE
jgi:glycosyltransferase involved in cell wall biosynthesis